MQRPNRTTLGLYQKILPEIADNVIHNILVIAASKMELPLVKTHVDDLLEKGVI